MPILFDAATAHHDGSLARHADQANATRSAESIRVTGPGGWARALSPSRSAPALDLALSGKVYPRSMAERALTIGEVAARSGISRKALRLYEARGILSKPRRTASGYRVYNAEVLGVLHFVTQARRLGFTLKEIGHIIDLRSAKSGPCGHVRALLEQKLADLESLRREVKKILDSWDASGAERGVVCQRIEGGKLPWTKSHSAHPVRPAQKSPSSAIPSVLVRRATSSLSRRRNGTSSST
jgi:DNA-binding transcriptional MerR regulator